MPVNLKVPSHVLEVCWNSKNVEIEEECPICKKSKELFDKAAQARKEGNEMLSKSLFKEACSLKKKRTFITRVIDRDHEDEGVKFWRFNENSKGEGIYDKLMSLFKTRKEEALEDGEEDYNILDEIRHRNRTQHCVDPYQRHCA